MSLHSILTEHPDYRALQEEEAAIRAHMPQVEANLRLTEPTRFVGVSDEEAVRLSTQATQDFLHFRERRKAVLGFIAADVIAAAEEREAALRADADRLTAGLRRIAAELTDLGETVQAVRPDPGANTRVTAAELVEARRGRDRTTYAAASRP